MLLGPRIAVFKLGHKENGEILGFKRHLDKTMLVCCVLNLRQVVCDIHALSPGYFI